MFFPPDEENGVLAVLLQHNSKHRSRLGRERIKRSPKEKHSGLLFDEKLNTSWQCAVTAQKDKRVLGCTQSSVVSRQRKVILTLSWDPHPQYCTPGLFPMRGTWTCRSESTEGPQDGWNTSAMNTGWQSSFSGLFSLVKAPGTPHSTLQYMKGLQESSGGTSDKSMEWQHKGGVFKLKVDRFRLDNRNSLLWGL